MTIIFWILFKGKATINTIVSPTHWLLEDRFAYFACLGKCVVTGFSTPNFLALQQHEVT